MKQIYLLSRMDSLNIKKDSSLFLALTSIDLGIETYLAFQDGLSWSSDYSKVIGYKFSGRVSSSYFIDGFSIGEKSEIRLYPGDILHMRVDPPIAEDYLKTVWMLEMFESSGIVVINSPSAIISNCDKLLAYKEKNRIPTLISSNIDMLIEFCNSYKDVVIKPVNSYSGIGVDRLKVDRSLSENLKSALLKHTTIIAQPFIRNVMDGEIRATYFNGRLIGAILKKPQPNSIISNISRGASYEPFVIKGGLKRECDLLAKKLLKDRIKLIGMDILDGKISEVNISSPGLLIEMSGAISANLAEIILSEIS